MMALVALATLATCKVGSVHSVNARYSSTARTSQFRMAAEPAQTWEEGMRIKDALLQYLQFDGAFVKLAPSSIAGAGVGVVALRNIPSGIDPFAPPNPQLRGRDIFVPFQAAELARLPTAVREHALNFFPVADGQQDNPVFAVPANGFASFDASWYVNHADEANVVYTEPDKGEEGSGFSTLRLIEEGEELLMDYRAVFPDLHARLMGPGFLDGSE